MYNKFSYDIRDQVYGQVSDQVYDQVRYQDRVRVEDVRCKFMANQVWYQVREDLA